VRTSREKVPDPYTFDIHGSTILDVAVDVPLSTDTDALWRSDEDLLDELNTIQSARDIRCHFRKNKKIMILSH
jgi:hypothetical protein